MSLIKSNGNNTGKGVRGSRANEVATDHLLKKKLMIDSQHFWQNHNIVLVFELVFKMIFYEIVPATPTLNMNMICIKMFGTPDIFFRSSFDNHGRNSKLFL